MVALKHKTMKSLVSETINSLYGVWLIGMRRPGAAEYFNISVDGFWRSFVAAALVFPANVIITSVSNFAIGEGSYGIHEGLRDVIIYLITWLFYPLLVIHISEFLGVGERALRYLIPYNWASIPTGYCFAFVSVLGGMEIGSLGVVNFGAWAFVLAYIFAIFLFFEIARRQFSISRLAAVGIVALDFIFSISLVSVIGGIR